MFLALSSLYHAIYKANVDVPLPSLLKKKKKKKNEKRNGQRVGGCRPSARCDTKDESDLASYKFVTGTSETQLLKIKICAVVFLFSLFFFGDVSVKFLGCVTRHGRET